MLYLYIYTITATPLTIDSYEPLHHVLYYPIISIFFLAEEGGGGSLQGTIDLWSEASLLRSETSLSGGEKEILFLQLQATLCEMQEIIGFTPANVVTGDPPC